MSQTRSRKRARSPVREGSPNPYKRTTRSATEKDKSLLSVQVSNPEPLKGRSQRRIVRVEHTAGAPRLFTRKGLQIRERLQQEVPNVNVIIDASDDRPGCFVVREFGGQLFLELLEMEPPFNRLARLNVNDFVAAIVRHMREHLAFNFNPPQ